MMGARELIVDLFAGGGGASEGIRMALGRDPDIAVNHDAEAVAMHRANHPGTLHLQTDVWDVNPITLIGNRVVGLLWASPDCKHFSKAKGGRPVKRKIRDLAFVVIKWARAVRPRVIMLENVEEFQTWGPLTQKLVDGVPQVDEFGRPLMVPCKARSGQTFRQWVGELERLGFKVDWRELRACDHGAPTIRKRLFLIARRDGAPIVWPQPTHGDPKSEAVKSGRLKPWRTAAEIIDWSLPCHSIFLTKDEGRAVRVKRPLADATMARIAKGVKRYVIDTKEPFVVPFIAGVGGRMGQTEPRPVTKPAQTLTAKADSVLVAPHVTKFHTGAVGSAGDEPVPTVTANSFIKRPGGASPLGVAQAFLTSLTHHGGDRNESLEEPFRTITAAHRGEKALIAPTLIQTGYGERPGQEPRVPGLDKPLGTVVAGGVKHAVVAPHLMTMRDAQKPHNEADKPTHTITAGGAHLNLVSAFLAQHNTDMVGHDAREPVSTITQKGCNQAVVSAGIVNQKGSDQRQCEVTDPAPTQTAGGWHIAETRAFLLKYYGQGVGAGLDEPAHTVTTKERFALCTVEIDGEPYLIVDIGMRMLTRRELFGAQGFRPDYEIERGVFILDGKPVVKPLTVTASIKMCGNSVSPVIPDALVGANLPDLILQELAA